MTYANHGQVNKAFEYYQKALKTQDIRASSQNLQKASQLYQKAINLGEELWKTQIKFLMEQNKISEQEAKKHAHAQYGGYHQKLQEWQRHYLEVQELLRKNKNH